VRVTRSREVDAWFAKLDHPLKDAMQRARRHILAADKRVEETIKWQCPTFTFNGNIVSINPKAKSHLSLLFHTGAQIPGKLPKLEGGGGTARYMKFTDLKDVEMNKAALRKVIKAWCDWKAPRG
jgi:hypothetical protein